MSETATTTRDRILDAAESLFSTQGFAGVGVREIVELAEVNLAAVNYHFGSKDALYLETVTRAMLRSEHDGAWSVLDHKPRNRKAAAVLLVRFIHRFFEQVMPTDGACENPCAMFALQEAAEPTGALDTIIRNFIEPHETKLRLCLSALMPDASKSELALASQSILGQILHYRTFAPFLERMQTHGKWSDSRLEELVVHIASFSLRAIGVPQSKIPGLIDCAIADELARVNGSRS